jgi:hypothetical protein
MSPAFTAYSMSRLPATVFRRLSTSGSRRGRSHGYRQQFLGGVRLPASSCAWHHPDSAGINCKLTGYLPILYKSKIQENYVANFVSSVKIVEEYNVGPHVSVSCHEGSRAGSSQTELARSSSRACFPGSLAKRVRLSQAQNQRAKVWRAPSRDRAGSCPALVGNPQEAQPHSSRPAPKRIAPGRCDARSKAAAHLGPKRPRSRPDRHHQ